MFYSASCEYAVRGLVHLAKQPRDRMLAVDQLAMQDEMPKYFLAKIFHRLARHGILRSTKGPGGGFALARAPQLITLQQVVDAMQGATRAEQCVVGLHPCDSAAPCPMHDSWQVLRGQIERYLQTTTIAELASGETERSELVAAGVESVV